MKLFRVSVIFILIIGTPILTNSAEQNYLISAEMPIEKVSLKTDWETGGYKTDGYLYSIGHLKINLARKRITVNHLVIMQPGHQKIDSNTPFRMNFEDIILTKIIKLSNLKYAFEAKNDGDHKLSGIIEIKIVKGAMPGKFYQVSRFEMNEHSLYPERGIWKKYILVNSEMGKALLKRFKNINFGNKLIAIVGDNQNSY